MLYPTTNRLCVRKYASITTYFSIIYRHYICNGAFHHIVFKELKIFSLWYILPFHFSKTWCIHKCSPNNRVKHLWCAAFTIQFQPFCPAIINTLSSIICRVIHHIYLKHFVQLFITFSSSILSCYTPHSVQ